MSGRVMIEYEGIPHDPFEPGRAWASRWASWTPEEVTYRREIVERGVYLIDGAPIPERRARLIRATILGTYKDQAPVFDPTADDAQVASRWIVDQLWREGHVPLLSGPPGIGKSMTEADLCAALVTPGGLFLRYFETVEWTEDEQNGVIYWINSENPAKEVHEELLRLGLLFDSRTDPDHPFYYHPAGGPTLIVEHLEESGGAAAFDLTVPEIYDEWFYRLNLCPCKEPVPLTPPLVVIGDGFTRVVGLERVGELYAAFRNLMHELDVKAALGVAHAGLGSKHAYDGVKTTAMPDGRWNLWSPDTDLTDSSARYLTATRRMMRGEVRGRIQFNEDDWLEFTPRAQKAGGAPGDTPEADDSGQSDGEARRDRMRDLLREAAAAGALTTALTGDGLHGQLNRKELEAMKTSGEVVSRNLQNGRVRSTRWWLSEFAPSAD